MQIPWDQETLMDQDSNDIHKGTNQNLFLHFSSCKTNLDFLPLDASKDGSCPVTEYQVNLRKTNKRTMKIITNS